MPDLIQLVILHYLVWKKFNFIFHIDYIDNMYIRETNKTSKQLPFYPL